MELGSTFGPLVTPHPTACAYLFGQSIGAFGADPVLWGTDSIWYGTPQWQTDAFRRFAMPAARVFGVDVNAARHELPKDSLSRIKMAYRADGPAPSHRWYGWVTR